MRTSIQVLGVILAVISLTIAQDLAVPGNKRNGSKFTIQRFGLIINFIM